MSAGLSTTITITFTPQLNEDINSVFPILSETGRIKYVNSEGQLVLINSHERLTGIDYGWFAQKAMDRQLYHTAIDFVKEGIRLHETKDEGIRRMHPQQFEMMQKFKKDLVKLNNG